jgi:hypothetical protein
VKTVLHGPMTYREPFFAWQVTLYTRIYISGTCIERNLPAVENISVPCGSISGRFHRVTCCCVLFRYMLFFEGRYYLWHICVDNNKMNNREIKCKDIDWNELCCVRSGGGYCDRRSVGPCFVMQDLPWPAKWPTVYRDEFNATIIILNCI